MSKQADRRKQEADARWTTRRRIIAVSVLSTRSFSLHAALSCFPLAFSAKLSFHSFLSFAPFFRPCLNSFPLFLPFHPFLFFLLAHSAFTRVSLHRLLSFCSVHPFRLPSLFTLPLVSFLHPCLVAFYGGVSFSLCIHIESVLSFLFLPSAVSFILLSPFTFDLVFPSVHTSRTLASFPCLFMNSFPLCPFVLAFLHPHVLPSFLLSFLAGVTLLRTVLASVHELISGFFFLLPLLPSVLSLHPFLCCSSILHPPFYLSFQPCSPVCYLLVIGLISLLFLIGTSCELPLRCLQVSSYFFLLLLLLLIPPGAANILRRTFSIFE